MCAHELLPGFRLSLPDASTRRIGRAARDGSSLHPLVWHERALKRLAELFQLADNWDGNEAPAPNAESFALASVALDALHEAGIEPTSISASGDGGIVLSLTRPGRVARLSIYNEGEITASRSSAEGSRTWDIGPTVDEIRRAVDELGNVAVH